MLRRGALLGAALLSLLVREGRARAALTPAEIAEVKGLYTRAEATSASRVRAMIARTDIVGTDAAQLFAEASRRVPFDDKHASFLHDLLFGAASQTSRSELVPVVVQGLLAAERRGRGRGRQRRRAPRRARPHPPLRRKGERRGRLAPRGGTRRRVADSRRRAPRRRGPLQGAPRAPGARSGQPSRTDPRGSRPGRARADRARERRVSACGRRGLARARPQRARRLREDRRAGRRRRRRARGEDGADGAVADARVGGAGRARGVGAVDRQAAPPRARRPSQQLVAQSSRVRRSASTRRGSGPPSVQPEAPDGALARDRFSPRPAPASRRRR